MPRYRIFDQHEPHFLTLTIVGWIDIFSRQRYRDIIIDSLKYCQREKGLVLYAYVIMTNHLHLVASVKPESGQTLSDVIRDFKKFTARQILNSVQNEPESRREWLLHLFKYFAYNKPGQTYKVWRAGNHPIILLSLKVAWQKVNYIHLNPVKAGWVDEPCHYLFSSAKNYAEEEGILKVELLDLISP